MFICLCVYDAHVLTLDQMIGYQLIQSIVAVFTLFRRSVGKTHTLVCSGFSHLSVESVAPRAGCQERACFQSFKLFYTILHNVQLCMRLVQCVNVKCGLFFFFNYFSQSDCVFVSVSVGSRYQQRI